MRILCFGDSNTYGFDPRSYLDGRYPAQSRWTDLLAQKTGWDVLNAGENGREIPRQPYALRPVHQMLTEAQPLDQLIVMLGSNDLLQGANGAEAASRMERFLAQLPMDSEKILLVAPPPMKPGAWVTEERLLTDSAQLAGAYQAVSRKLGVCFADAGCWNVGLAFDGVHFSEEGHKAFAEGIYFTLTK